MTFKILTCFQNIPSGQTVKHSTNRFTCGVVTLQHDHWIGIPRVEEGNIENGGVCCGLFPRGDKMLAALKREVPDPANPPAYIIIDDERVYPEIEEPPSNSEKWNRGVMHRVLTSYHTYRWNIKQGISEYYRNEYYRYRHELKAIYRALAPNAKFGIWGLPNGGEGIDYAPMDDLLDVGCIMVCDEGDGTTQQQAADTTDRYIKNLREFRRRKPRTNSDPPDLIQCMVLPNVTRFMSQFKRLIPLFETGELQPYLWCPCETKTNRTHAERTMVAIEKEMSR